MIKQIQWYWWVIGVGATVWAAGYAASSFVGRIATVEDVDAVDSKHTGYNRETQKNLQKIDKKVDRIELIQDRVDSRQTQIETKIDWLIHDRLEQRGTSDDNTRQ